jgi:xylan 1,4-beta-xylosidase
MHKPLSPLVRVAGLLPVLVAGVAVSTAAESEPTPIGAAPFPVAIRVDVAKHLGPMKPVWHFFGYDEPNYTYQENGKKLLSQIAALSSGPAFIRAHNLLTSGDGTPALKWGSTGVYTEDADGHAHYDWKILDRIFDTYHERGLRPLVEIGFMPEALSTHAEPYQHAWTPAHQTNLFTGWSYPPGDWAKWGELVHQWAQHCVDRYGRNEVEQWYWEVWNEPNIGYWHGNVEGYERLYDYAVEGVRRALPTARVGGPHVAGPKTDSAARFLTAFLEHCLHGTNWVTGKMGSPLDFVAFHAKGAPRFVDGHVRMGIASQLMDIDRGFRTVASFPELRDKPVIIGESDPDGCAACSEAYFPQNGYRNGTLYASYTATAFARTYELAAKRGVNLEGAVTWAFEFEQQPWFAGFRALASNGVELPVFNVFRMFGHMGGELVAVESPAAASLETISRQGVRGAPEVNALASLQDRKLCVMVWHYHEDALPGPPAEIDLDLAGLPVQSASARLEHYRIDDDHSNSFAEWKRMGSPENPTPEQCVRLENAAKLTLLTANDKVSVTSGNASLRFSLPRQAVSLVVLNLGNGAD